ncbi:MAG: DUF983 domain-containing protein [Caulobacterales bacterium]
MTAPSPFVAGVRSRCPQCGEGRLFSGYLQFADRCETCGADFKIADAGDGPAVFVIFIVGAIVTPFLFILQFGFDLPGWLSITLTMIATVVLCLALLPPFKATLFALQWKNKASEVRNDDVALDDH